MTTDPREDIVGVPEATEAETVTDPDAPCGIPPMEHVLIVRESRYSWRDGVDFAKHYGQYVDSPVRVQTADGYELVSRYVYQDYPVKAQTVAAALEEALARHDDSPDLSLEDRVCVVQQRVASTSQDERLGGFGLHTLHVWRLGRPIRPPPLANGLILRIESCERPSAQITCEWAITEVAGTSERRQQP